MSYADQQLALIESLRLSTTGRTDCSTIPMLAEHSSTARCLTTVAFLPAPIAAPIEREAIHALRQLEPRHHYYSADALHVTVKNVRVLADPPAFDRPEVDAAARAIGSITTRHQTIALRLHRLIATRTSVALFGTSDERLRDLVVDLDGALRAAGVADDKSYVSQDVFFMNVTICRFAAQPTAAFVERVTLMEHALEVPFEIDRLELTSFDGLCRRSSRVRWAEFSLQSCARGEVRGG